MPITGGRSVDLGAYVTSSQLNSKFRRATKEDDEPRLDTDSPVIDSDLFVAVAANEVIDFNLVLFLELADIGVQGWKGGMIFPADFTGVIWRMQPYIVGQPLNGGDIFESDDTTAVYSADQLTVKINGTLFNGPNAGSIALHWAQGFASPTEHTTVKAGSRMECELR